jgi:hypothetical protein
MVGTFKGVSALDPAPLGVAFNSESDESSHDDEEHSDSVLVLVNVLASELSGTFSVVVSDVVDDRVDPMEELLG